MTCHELIETTIRFVGMSLALAFIAGGVFGAMWVSRGRG